MSKLSKWGLNSKVRCRAMLERIHREEINRFLHFPESPFWEEDEYINGETEQEFLDRLYWDDVAKGLFESEHYVDDYDYDDRDFDDRDFDDRDFDESCYDDYRHDDDWCNISVDRKPGTYWRLNERTYLCCEVRDRIYFIDVLTGQTLDSIFWCGLIIID